MKTKLRTENKRSERRGLGIQWRLLGYLGIFICFMLAVLWVFQILLLNPFYERIKSREMEKTVRLVETVLGDNEAIEDTVYRCAAKYSVCIEVWHVRGGHSFLVASADVSKDCIIHHVSPDFLSELYVNAKENGGEYKTKVSLSPDGFFRADSDGKRVRDKSDLREENVSSLYVKLTEDSAGEPYIVMLDAGLTPMSATVTTLKAQFSLIALTMFVGALLLAYLMSRRISRPLVRMNAAARRLAEGEYDVHFSGNGYRETKELAQTLNYAAEELSKTDRLQKELISNISHDLRTPLTMIRGYSEVMRDIPGENTPENFQVLIDETARLSELVDDLLDLSKVQSGTRVARPEVFNLTETVREVMLRYEKLIGHDGYRISFEASEDVTVRADKNMMLQVIYNLINNAVNYCGEDRTVIVRQIKGGGRVRLCVCDHGEGIPQEQIPLIWERYYKVDRVHRRAMIGTGLGLSIVKEILELHDAAYGVESRQGEQSGSVFWFDLVIVPSEEQEDARTSDGGEMPGTAKDREDDQQ